eukprot:6175582-Pleurochrysis_carterae.AAC.2
MPFPNCLFQVFIEQLRVQPLDTSVVLLSDDSGFPVSSFWPTCCSDLSFILTFALAKWSCMSPVLIRNADRGKRSLLLSFQRSWARAQAGNHPRSLTV